MRHIYVVAASSSSRTERESIRNALDSVVSPRIHEHPVALWELRRKQRNAQTQEWGEVELAAHDSLGPLCSTAYANPTVHSAAVARPSATPAATARIDACVARFAQAALSVISPLPLRLRF
jgi:hypothetical protein